MKMITALLLLLTVGTYVAAQTMDTVLIIKKARKFKPSENILVMFEILDTVDAVGKNITMSRSYYFDKQHRISDLRGQLDQKTDELALLRAGARQEEIERKQKLVETKKMELAKNDKSARSRELTQPVVPRCE